MWPRSLRRLLLRIGYRLPRQLRRPFHRYLYDDEPPGAVMTFRDPPRDSQLPVEFEFVGGCRDGEKLRGSVANPFYWGSNYGLVPALR